MDAGRLRAAGQALARPAPAAARRLRRAAVRAARSPSSRPRRAAVGRGRPATHRAERPRRGSWTASAPGRSTRRAAAAAVAADPHRAGPPPARAHPPPRAARRLVALAAAGRAEPAVRRCHRRTPTPPACRTRAVPGLPRLAGGPRPAALAAAWRAALAGLDERHPARDGRHGGRPLGAAGGAAGAAARRDAGPPSAPLARARGVTLATVSRPRGASCSAGSPAATTSSSAPPSPAAPPELPRRRVDARPVHQHGAGAGAARPGETARRAADPAAGRAGRPARPPAPRPRRDPAGRRAPASCSTPWSSSRTTRTTTGGAGSPPATSPSTAGRDATHYPLDLVGRRRPAGRWRLDVRPDRLDRGRRRPGRRRDGARARRRWPPTRTRPSAGIDVLADERAGCAWNDTARDGARRPRCRELFAAQVARTPDAPAVVFEGAALTYAELDARVGRRPPALPRRGASGRATRSPSPCRARWTWWSRCSPSTGPARPTCRSTPTTRPTRIAFMLDDAGAAAVVARPPPTSPPAGRPCRRAPRASPVAVTPHHPAYVIYTSGSTGRPKGVVVSHGAIVEPARVDARRVRARRPADRVLQKTPAELRRLGVGVLLAAACAARPWSSPGPAGTATRRTWSRRSRAAASRSPTSCRRCCGPFLDAPDAGGCRGLRLRGLQRRGAARPARRAVRRHAARARAAQPVRARPRRRSTSRAAAPTAARRSRRASRSGGRSGTPALHVLDAGAAAGAARRRRGAVPGRRPARPRLRRRAAA